MKNLTALLCGLLFGVGLIISGMSNPSKVLGFLDVFGRWDPSLALVMGGAVSVAAIGFALARRRQPKPATARRGIDRRLLSGAAIFGIGWGIAGICPGPALVLVGMNMGEGWIFALSMVAGMLLFNLLDKPRAG
ncbi:DUF6691 family protein [Pseudomonas sp. 5P_3.1_Bac2]|uniref:DUF6691 family protein n=1 Tax=Pseudomonas sp. 5P_3.1_Bac2 TaxID=2971617 RepID=UPI0021CA1014|nr:DUF6691 family protein [Pseudomonas sp. 5P_3.1_Bac2]MCU1719504.1 YeeE/YedE family protein [Pseudomonas sp. 5P_3.1_Bac2]